jgi:hypothetical protein
MKQAEPITTAPDTERLHNLIDRGECVLFLGAGVSIDSGAPSGDELAQELVEEFLKPEHRGYALDEICQIIEANFGRQTLDAWLTRRFERLTPADPLLQIPEFQWKSIYTVNFDTLLEASYARNRNCTQNLRPFYSDEDKPDALRSDEVALYKLHGCLSRIDAEIGHPVLTKRDYARVQRTRRNLYHRLFADGSDLTILYVGFSRRDPDFYQVLVDIADSAGAETEIPWSYAVQPEFDEYEYIRWHHERVTLIQATAMEFFQGLGLKR